MSPPGGPPPWAPPPPGAVWSAPPAAAPATAVPPTAPTRSPVVDALEYLLRIAFFALVPFAIVLLAQLVPMTAAFVNMALALAAFFSGEVLAGTAQRRPWLARVLKRQLAFEAYYRQHPPRPFLYYIAYPVLMPYWLIVREARREFWLFKGYTLLTLLVVTVAGVYRYFAVYLPELHLEEFVAAFAVGLLVETLAVMIVVMPMTTTVVALHQRRQHKRLVALLAVGLVSTLLALGWMTQRHRAFPSLETRQRVAWRSAADRVRSKRAMQHALASAWKVRRTARQDEWERETDGTVLGTPLEEAQRELGAFYRPDEAAAFELWTTSRKEKPALMVVFAEGRKKGQPVWLGMRPDGTLVEKLPEVPKTARKAMRSAGEF